MADVTVRGCAECPMRPKAWAQCAAESKALTFGQAVGEEPPPSWCPLRAGPLVVRLEVGRGE